MSAALASGESAKLSGFGVFTVRHKNERVGRNPKTGVTVPIEPRRSLTFSESPLLKTRINGGTPESAQDGSARSLRDRLNWQRNE